MKVYITAILLVLFFFSGCKKDKQQVSGTETIETTLYGTGPYYALGFSFSRADFVSTLDDPGPDITLIADSDIDGTIRRLMMQTENFKSSFYKFGQYKDGSSASNAFKSLTSANVTQWAEWGDTIKPHQIWIFRTATERYAKFRIISTLAEQRNGNAYGECTFEWVYQPDGSLTFPGK